MLTVCELSRLESLGDNCELGFVLRRHKFEEGGFFRWALVKAPSLINILETRFAGAYLRDNLKPHVNGMVRDLSSGACYHTKMVMKDANGVASFISDPDSLDEIYSRDRKKIEYLTSKFIGRAKDPSVLYVLKTNSQIEENVLDHIRSLICSLSAVNHINLLLVQQSPKLAGRLERIKLGMYRGYLEKLAPYNRSNDLDLVGWVGLLRSALRLVDEDLCDRLSTEAVARPDESETA